MSTTNTQSLNFNSSKQGKDTKKANKTQLFNLLHKKPLTRRMAATQLGFPDQTYMVTQYISDWITQDKAMVIGVIKCERSGRTVQAITTDPNLFPQTNQLKMF